MHDVSTLAAIQYEARFPIDSFMTKVAQILASEGVRLGGVIQENDETLREDGSCCASMSIVDLRTRERFGISQDLGAESRGCRLDPRGLVEVESRLNAAVAASVELLLLNKFGRAEAEGRGLRGVLAHAIEAGVPVLTAVRAPYDEMWREFHGGLAMTLPPDERAVLDWCRGLVRQARSERFVAAAT